MLSWIRNLHTCKTEGFCWHGGVWPVLGPSPPQAQQEQPQECCSLLPWHQPCIAHRWAAPCWHVALP